MGTTTLLLLLAASRASSLLHPGLTLRTCGTHTHARCRTALQTPNEQITPIDLQILQASLQAVRSLPRISDDYTSGGDEREDAMLEDAGMEPSYRRLFTHETWSRYNIDRSPLERFWKTIVLWHKSRVSQAILPCVGCFFGWGFLVALLFPLCAPRTASRAAQMWIPLSLQGTAIGLLLVFRTNNAYLRLAEAREQWGKLLMLLREVTTKASMALSYETTCDICRYLCAFMWSLRDKLRDGDTRDDILSLLLTGEELGWVISQRSRPLALLSRIRRLIFSEYKDGTLDSTMHYMIDCDLKEIDTVVESCERLFSSPIPPNMARHGMRSLALWLCALPLVITSSMPPLLVAMWTASTSYIYLGVDELGVQVEQPFQILPLWQLCHLAQLNVEEALSTPDLPLRLNRQTTATPSPLSCSSGNPFGN